MKHLKNNNTINDSHHFLNHVNIYLYMIFIFLSSQPVHHEPPGAQGDLLQVPLVDVANPIGPGRFLLNVRDTPMLCVLQAACRNTVRSAGGGSEVQALQNAGPRRSTVRLLQ